MSHALASWRAAREAQCVVMAVDALGQVTGSRVLVAFGGAGVPMAELALDEVQRLALD